jgi:hypothetical protein
MLLSETVERGKCDASPMAGTDEFAYLALRRILREFVPFDTFYYLFNIFALKLSLPFTNH